MKSVELTRGTNGPEKVVVSHSSGARAEAYLHGAHVASWRTPDGRERLFLSSASHFAPGVAIRGGVPVIFPQFADRGPLPKHGFARVLSWRFMGGDESGGAPRAVFALEDCAETRAVWPFAFEARLAVTLGELALSIELSVVNRGDGPLEFTAALHSYLTVGDVSRVSVGGLRGRAYESRAEGVSRAMEQREELSIEGEVDRVYVDVAGPVTVRDAVTREELELQEEGFRDLVLWNPGAEKARALKDLGAGEWRQMLCVEAAQVATPIPLPARAAWRGSQTMTVVGEAERVQATAR